MLRIIFDRLAMQCSENARQLSTAPAYFSVHSIKTERLGKILEAAEGKVVAAILHVQAWDARIMVGLDNRLVFGGRGPVRRRRQRGALCRKPRLDEYRDARRQRRSIDLPAGLHRAFSVIEETHFKFERVRDAAWISRSLRRATISLSWLKLNWRIPERADEFFVAIPQAALNPIRQSLTADHSNDATAPDPRWSNRSRQRSARPRSSCRRSSRKRALRSAISSP